jgi:glycosyltransferase involved in cell wall biosynthesis
MKPLQTVLPAVTVLMSVFNGEKWLEISIKSILNQTFEDFEFIIVDDGSTDNSLAIIKHFQTLDSRIVVIAKINTGLADSLNHGIRLARGVWIARIDADDISEPTRLEKQLALANCSSNIVFVGAGLMIIDANGRTIETYSYPTQHEQLLSNLRTLRKFPAHSSAFYKRQIVSSLNGYRPRIRRSEDHDLWLRMSQFGEFRALQEPLIRLRHHQEQISNDEGGMRQLFDGRLATVSYWLRSSGMPDPIDASEEDFKVFYEWLHDQCVDDDFFEYCAFLVAVRSEFAREPRTLKNILNLMTKLLLKPALLIYLIKLRYFGDTSARRIALKWRNR